MSKFDWFLLLILQQNERWELSLLDSLRGVSSPQPFEAVRFDLNQAGYMPRDGAFCHRNHCNHLNISCACLLLSSMLMTLRDHIYVVM